MPHDPMTLSTLSTYSPRIADRPVSGLTPRLARVAAITARSRQVTDTEHCLKYKSTTGSGGSVRISKLRSMWPIARLRWPVSLSDL